SLIDPSFDVRSLILVSLPLSTLLARVDITCRLCQPTCAYLADASSPIAGRQHGTGLPAVLSSGSPPVPQVRSLLLRLPLGIDANREGRCGRHRAPVANAITQDVPSHAGPMLAIGFEHRFARAAEWTRGQLRIFGLLLVHFDSLIRSRRATDSSCLRIKKSRV